MKGDVMSQQGLEKESFNQNKGHSLRCHKPSIMDV